MSIGISEDRLHHIIGVARKAYAIAASLGYGEDFCYRMFMLGWLHDIGYEFAETQEEHPDESARMLLSLIDGPAPNDLKWPAYRAIKFHGRYLEENSTEWKILNMADLQVDSKGNEISVSGRLDEIKERYGEHSDQYLTACDIAYVIGLTAINLAGNIT